MLLLQGARTSCFRVRKEEAGYFSEVEFDQGNRVRTRTDQGGKRPALEEVSSLGKYGVDLCDLNLSKLLRGRALILLYILNQNRIGI